MAQGHPERFWSSLEPFEAICNHLESFRSHLEPFEAICNPLGVQKALGSPKRVFQYILKYTSL